MLIPEADQTLHGGYGKGVVLGITGETWEGGGRRLRAFGTRPTRSTARSMCRESRA